MHICKISVSYTHEESVVGVIYYQCMHEAAFDQTFAVHSFFMVSHPLVNLDKCRRKKVF